MAVEYELFYLVGESKESSLPAIREAVEKTVVTFKGSFLPPQTEEKRKLAYPVKKEIRGTYVARRFTLPDMDETEQHPDENHPLVDINREFRLNSDILRFLIVRADALPELKPIERVERPRTESKAGRYEKRGALRPMPQAPVTPKEEARPVSQEQIDKQLKEKLDI